jgi:hypothetical protein
VGSENRGRSVYTSRRLASVISVFEAKGFGERLAFYFAIYVYSTQDRPLCEASHIRAPARLT